MDNTPHVYDLGINISKKRRVAPELLCVIDEDNFDELINRIARIRIRCAFHTDNYLMEDDKHFYLPKDDMFSQRAFGYQRCGYVTKEDGRVSFRLPIKPYPTTSHCALTITVLTTALYAPFAKATHRVQQVLLSTLARTTPFAYAHAVGGWLSADVVRWLKSYVDSKFCPESAFDTISMHPRIIHAMRMASKSISRSRKQWYRADRTNIYGRIRSSGAFFLNCFGNACDLGVYSLNDSSSSLGSVELSCHNLDTAEQQLVLLAGLAKICELARTDC